MAVAGSSNAVIEKMSDLDVRLNRYKKLITSRNPSHRRLPQRRVFIFGCQRSGTSMLRRVFDELPYSRVYRETNALVNSMSGDNQLQIRNIGSLGHDLAADSRPLQVMKPLVDSQNAGVILDGVEASLGIWIFRHYTLVAESNIRKFGEHGGGFAHLDAIASASPTNWRSQGASKSTVDIVRRLMRGNRTPIDAGCLFWYTRNVLLFEQALERRNDLLVWKYENFVSRPRQTLDGLLTRLGYPPSPPSATGFVKATWTGDGSLSARIEELRASVDQEIVSLCDALQSRLERIASKESPG